jgi:hypothetical protein
VFGANAFNLGNILSPVTRFRIHQNLFIYEFTL